MLRLVVKTSARNQLFGRINEIRAGAVNAELSVELKGGQLSIVTLSLALLNDPGLKPGADTVLLINSTDIILAIDSESHRFSAHNHLSCRIIRMQRDDVNAEVIVLLPVGETLTAMVTQQSIQNMGLKTGMSAWAIFKTSAPIPGVMIKA